MYNCIRNNRRRHRSISLCIHTIFFLILQTGIITISTIGNLLTDEDRNNFEKNITPINYDVSDPIIGEEIIDNTIKNIIRVKVGFINPENNEYNYCNNIIFDTCDDSEECNILVRYITERNIDRIQIQGWYYPGKECKGIYFTKTYISTIDMMTYIMIWLSCSFTILITWRICCIKGIIISDCNEILCDGQENMYCCRRRVTLPIQQTLVMMRESPIYNTVAAERETNIRPIKVVDEEDDMCIISMERIPKGGIYSECNQCKKIYDYMSLQRWLSTRNICPHCRCSMTPYTIRMYQNGYTEDITTNYHQIRGGEFV